MKKNLLLVLACFIYLSSFSQTKEICISLDDLPMVSYDFKSIEFQRTALQKLLHIFGTYHIPAIGFVNENKLYLDGDLNPEKVGKSVV